MWQVATILDSTGLEVWPQDTLESLQNLAIDIHYKEQAVISEAAKFSVLSLIFSPVHFDSRWKQHSSVV